MGVVDDIKKAGSTVTEGAGKFVNVQRQQRQLRSLQDDVTRLQQDLGEITAGLLERGELAHPALDAPRALLKHANEAVAAKEAEIASLKPELDADGGTRSQYTERLKTQVGEWSGDIERLKARAGEASDSAKTEYDEQIASLREQRDSLAAKLSDLQDASDDAWADVKQGAQGAWDRAKESFQKAKSRFG
ncbi:MAG: hypothetical protein R2826_11120 [Thermoleophilia bacterium]